MPNRMQFVCLTSYRFLAEPVIHANYANFGHIPYGQSLVSFEQLLLREIDIDLELKTIVNLTCPSQACAGIFRPKVRANLLF